MRKLALLLSIIVLAAGISRAQTSGFTYQGKLADGGSPANGSYQFACKLFDAATDGNQVGPTQTVFAAGVNPFSLAVGDGSRGTRDGVGACCFEVTEHEHSDHNL